MPNLNLAVIEGHASRDAEVKYSQGGMPIATIGVATNNYNGKGKESTPEWHNVVAFRQLAENAAHIKKGWIVRVHGRIQTRSWDKDGVKHYRTEIVADALSAEPPRGQSDHAAQARQAKPSGRPPRGDDPFGDDGDGDVPF